MSGLMSEPMAATFGPMAGPKVAQMSAAMTGPMGGVPDVVIELALLALAIALLLTFVRLVRGPDLVDRVVALELIASLVAGIVAVYAIGTDEPAIIDVAIALALVAFLGAVAFARYAERSMRP